MGSVSFIDGHIDEPMNAEEYIEVIKRLKLKLENLTDLYNRQKADLENYKQIAEFQQSISMDKEVEIKRLKAEVEGLQAEIGIKNLTIQGLEQESILHNETVAEEIELVKAEAVKEFAERLKGYYPSECMDDLELCKIVDDLLKEMGAEGE
jgi:hypothetical protein